MIRVRSFFLLVLLIVGIGVVHAANDPSLYLDGRFRVQGASLRNAKVTVLREGVTMIVLTGQPERVRVRLDLQSTYTLSFEQAGCRTKEIFVDTRMDAAAVANAPYTFYFDVTLEPVSVVGDAPYAGPVGYVRYVPGANDFGYDVDYRLTHDAHGNVVEETGMGTDATASVKDPSIFTHRVRGERHYVQPFIDPTKEMERNKARQDSIRDALSAARNVALVPVGVQGVSSTQVKAVPTVDPSAMHRTVIIEQERVITITRVKSHGRVTEYRQVAHANGTVLHYKDGSTCSYAEYVSVVGADQ